MRTATTPEKLWRCHSVVVVLPQREASDVLIEPALIARGADLGEILESEVVRSRVRLGAPVGCREARA